MSGCNSGLNEAYAVLNDVQKGPKKAYDQERTEKAHSQTTRMVRDDAFDTALGALENRWQIAVDIFPDLSQIRKQLAQTGHRRVRLRSHNARKQGGSID